MHEGFLSAGGDLAVVNVTSVQEALDACTAHIECRAITYSSTGANGTIPNGTVAKVYLKKAAHRSGQAPWWSWYKIAPMDPPASVVSGGGLTAAIRTESFTVQWLNHTASATTVSNYSWVPALTPGSALPLVQHLGDVTLRVRPASSPSSSSSTAPGHGWSFFASAWGPFSAEATPLTPTAEEFVAHDITPLLDATRKMAPQASAGEGHGGAGGGGAAGEREREQSPLRVRRAYLKPNASQPGLGIAFTLSNAASVAIEVGGFGMAMPTAHAQDAHRRRPRLGRMALPHDGSAPRLEQSVPRRQPLNRGSSLEAFRPIFEFGGGVTYDWTVHTRAWASEWEENRQWPFLYMADALNATGIWPHPRSPWPGWGDGGATVRTNFTRETHWNQPTSRVLRPGESVSVRRAAHGMPGRPTDARCRTRRRGRASPPRRRVIRCRPTSSTRRSL